MLFRNDYGSTAEDWAAWRAKRLENEKLPGPPLSTNLGLATSDNGVDWKVEAEPVWQWNTQEVSRVYDPRITVIDGKLLVCFAMDTKHGIRGGIAETKDFKTFDVKTLTVPDNRNMVLFPEKIQGHYYRLERPFPVYGRWGQSKFDVWMSSSPDLVYWGKHKLVLGVEHVPFANDKIGPAAPPVKTPRGWLTTFHSVWLDYNKNLGGWEPTWHKRYDAGLMLLDLNEPWKVIGLHREPLILPDQKCELDGFRNAVIFPCGLIAEPNGEVKIYYGAADTCVCLATAKLDDLLDLCKPVDWTIEQPA